MPVRVTARGVAGHASVPTLGDNALLKLAPVLERLAAYAPVLRPSPELDALLDVVAPGDGAAGRSASSGAAPSTSSSGTCCRPSRARRSCPTMAGGLAQAQRDSGRGLASSTTAACCRAPRSTSCWASSARRCRASTSSSSWPSRRSAARARRSTRRCATRSPSGSTSSSPARCSCRSSARASPTRTSCGRPSGRSPTVSFRCATRRPNSLNTIHAPDERIDVRDLELAVRSFVHCIDRIGSVVA